MAKGKMRIGYAVMTKNGGNLVKIRNKSSYLIFGNKSDAVREVGDYTGWEVVRVTVDVDA